MRLFLLGLQLLLSNTCLFAVLFFKYSYECCVYLLIKQNLRIRTLLNADISDDVEAYFSELRFQANEPQ
jgi:hypothetical protein